MTQDYQFWQQEEVIGSTAPEDLIGFPNGLDSPDVDWS